MAVVAGELLDEAIRVVVVPQAQRGQLDARGPPLGPRVERLNLHWVQRLACDPLDRLARLLARKGQGVLADLGHLVPKAEAERVGQSVVAADEDEAHAVGRPFGELAELVEHEGAGQRFEVLDHHGDRGGVRQLGQHDGEEVLAEGDAVPPEVGQGPPGRARHDGVEGLAQAATEPGRVVGGARHHSHGSPLRVGPLPLGEEDGFAVTGGRHDPHDPLPGRQLEAVDEGRTAHDEGGQGRQHAVRLRWSHRGHHRAFPSPEGGTSVTSGVSTLRLQETRVERPELNAPDRPAADLLWPRPGHPMIAAGPEGRPDPAPTPAGGCDRPPRRAPRIPAGRRAPEGRDGP